jgi:TATA-binding protein-associated factor Taf7
MHIIIDKRPGGIGVSEALFKKGPAMLSKVLSILDACPCEHGCLSCILSPICINECLHKGGTRLLARRVYELVSSNHHHRSSTTTTTTTTATVVAESVGPDDGDDDLTSATATVSDNNKNDRDGHDDDGFHVFGGISMMSSNKKSRVALVGGSYESKDEEVIAVEEEEEEEDDDDDDGDDYEFESTASALERSPCRRQRLGLARDMSEAKTRGSHIKQSWTNTLIPDFHSMYDE